MFIFQANKDMRSNIGVIMSQRILQLYPERRDISILDCGAGTGLRAQEVRGHRFACRAPSQYKDRLIYVW